jgi:DNA-binding transcriptional regulator YiaG
MQNSAVSRRLTRPAELRALARELRAVRTILADSRRPAARPNEQVGIPPEQIRAARHQFGESRKAFAHRLGVSPGIVFAWESGRSAPRRKAIVARLRRVLAARTQRKSGQPRKRVLTLSPKRRAALKLQGQYMGYLRSLAAPQRAEVKKLKAANGLPAAVRLARKLRRQ